MLISSVSALRPSPWVPICTHFLPIGVSCEDHSSQHHRKGHLLHIWPELNARIARKRLAEMSRMQPEQKHDGILQLMLHMSC